MRILPEDRAAARDQMTETCAELKLLGDGNANRRKLLMAEVRRLVWLLWVDFGCLSTD
jgi:hypothetical protein